MSKPHFLIQKNPPKTWKYIWKGADAANIYGSKSAVVTWRLKHTEEIQQVWRKHNLQNV